MKKIALTSLLAMVAATAANANVINGNPLYKPAAGHFASVTTLSTHTNTEVSSVAQMLDSTSTKDWMLGETFDYGVTDDLTIGMSTSVSRLVKDNYNAWAWNNFGLNVDYRIFNIDGWVLDGVAGYSVNPVGARWQDAADEVSASFLLKEDTYYTWTYGIKGGYMGEMFTVAGHAIFGYGNSESFNWNEKNFSDEYTALFHNFGNHYVNLGLDGQIIITDWLNVTMGVNYTAQLDSHVYLDGVEYDAPKNRGTWSGILGLNFNIDETKYVGVYVNGGLHHEEEESGIDYKSAWKVDTGMGMGVKFGIDF